MRNFIDIVEAAGMETFVTTNGKEVQVWKNPGKTQFRGILANSEHDELRGFLMGDLYVWDAAIAVHADLMDHLNMHGAVKLVLKPDYIEISYRDETDSDEVEEDYVGEHPAIVRAYGKPVSAYGGML